MLTLATLVVPGLVACASDAARMRVSVQRDGPHHAYLHVMQHQSRCHCRAALQHGRTLVGCARAVMAVSVCVSRRPADVLSVCGGRRALHVHGSPGPCVLRSAITERDDQSPCVVTTYCHFGYSGCMCAHAPRRCVSPGNNHEPAGWPIGEPHAAHTCRLPPLRWQCTDTCPVTFSGVHQRLAPTIDTTRGCIQ